MAKGPDRIGKLWADDYGYPVKTYPADWDNFGKSAGYRRNEEMVKNADALIAFWDGKSPGTKHMIDLALKKPLDIIIILR